MTAGPIPFTAVVTYSTLYDVGNFHEFLAIIRLMDHCYLDLSAKAGEKSSGANG